MSDVVQSKKDIPYLNPQQQRTYKSLSMFCALFQLIWTCGVVFADFMSKNNDKELYFRSTFLYIIYILTSIIMSCCLFIRKNTKEMLISTIFFYNPITIYIYNVIFFQSFVIAAACCGKYFGISIILSTIFDIYIILTIYTNSYEQNQSIKAVKKQKKEFEECDKLLKEIGKQFFVKNFNIIKTWDVNDILDTLNSKQGLHITSRRVMLGKEIFKKGYELIALDIISNSEDSLDSETIKAAKEFTENILCLSQRYRLQVR